MMLINRDPTAPHRAAAFLARLVACGLLGRAEALAALLNATAPVRISPCLRQARLATPQALPPATCRAQTAKAVRSVLRPLLVANASRTALMAAALQAARPILRRDEIELLIADAVARHLRDRRRQARAARPNPHP